MEFREKDTAIILFCCILIVLLIIFFLSERQKFTLNNIDSSPEGCHDIYTLSAHIYKLDKGSGTERGRKLIHSRNIQIERMVLYLGADRRGEMLVQVSSPFPDKEKTFRARLVKPVDLSVDFLPEGCINFPFFDADIIKHRGQMLHRGEEWKYIRPLSLYGNREFSTEVRYTFKGKVRKGESTIAQIGFKVQAKKWIDKGLNCIDRFAGSIWVNERNGKVEEVEYRFYKFQEHNSYYTEVSMERLRSGILGVQELEKLRESCGVSMKPRITDSVQKKKIVPLRASGSGKELEKNMFPRADSSMYTVQIRAFARNEDGKNKAGKLRKALAAKGYTAFVIADKNMYKVCVGRFPSSDNPGLRKRHDLMRQFFKDAFIRKVK